jgi:hypothetical protein
MIACLLLGGCIGITGETVIQCAHQDTEHRQQQKDKARKQTSVYEKRWKVRKILIASKVAKK